MKISPDLDEVSKIAAAGKYGVLPVNCEMPSGFRTPAEALKKLKMASSHCYLLESAARSETWGRYAFLGFDPNMEITCIDGKMSAGDAKLRTDNPSAFLRRTLSGCKSPRIKGQPPFTCGHAGYFAYDYAGDREPGIKTGAKDTEGFKEAGLMLFDKVIASDSFRQKIILIVNMPLGDPEKGYSKGVSGLDRMHALPRRGGGKRGAGRAP